MFSKSDKAQEGAAGAAPATASNLPGKPTASVSIISTDLKIVGDLQSAGDIEVAGVVEGDIRSRCLTISESAHIKGSVMAERVVISGAISGQVRANNVMVKKTAKVMGDVAHESLSIEAGAHLEGRFSREDFGSGQSASTPQATKPATTGNGAAPSRPQVVSDTSAAAVAVS
ncbi:MAG: polymer-forming cytoskeletal protein [Kiloniellales bacterium]|nr:polymer-forming cytoskeletal protein [Kiloniellales bacterium]